MDANIVALIIGLCAGLPGILSLIIQYRKDRQERPQNEISVGLSASKQAAETISSYSAELKQVREQLRQVREEQKDIVEELERLQQANLDKDQLIEEWRIGIERLIAQVVSLGHTPVWRPRSVKADVK